MRRVLFGMALLFSMFFATGYGTADESFTYPQPCDLLQFVQGPEEMYEGPTFYPVGWSADGKFAYVERRELDGIGGSRTEYYIFDAVTDSVLFTIRDDDIPDEPPGGPPGEEPAGSPGVLSEEVSDGPGTEEASPLKDPKQEFADALQQYGIEQGKGTTLKPFPLTVEGDTFTVQISTTPERDKDAFNDTIGTYTVTVDSAGRGRKQITGGADIRALELWIAGCFVSPFESRMLVAIGRQAYVFEGTEPFFQFSGCHLRVGFK